VRLGADEDLHHAGQQPVGAVRHVHGLDDEPQRTDLDYRSHSRDQAAQLAYAETGQVVFTAVAPWRN